MKPIPEEPFNEQKPEEAFHLPPEFRSAIDALARCTGSGDHSEAVGLYLIGLGFEKTGDRFFKADPKAKGAVYKNQLTGTTADVRVADFLGIFTDIKFAK